MGQRRKTNSSSQRCFETREHCSPGAARPLISQGIGRRGSGRRLLCRDCVEGSGQVVTQDGDGRVLGDHAAQLLGLILGTAALSTTLLGLQSVLGVAGFAPNPAAVDQPLPLAVIWTPRTESERITTAAPAPDSQPSPWQSGSA